jgi:hypothetical protein
MHYLVKKIEELQKARDIMVGCPGCTGNMREISRKIVDEITVTREELIEIMAFTPGMHDEAFHLSQITGERLEDIQRRIDWKYHMNKRKQKHHSEGQ